MRTRRQEKRVLQKKMPFKEVKMSLKEQKKKSILFQGHMTMLWLIGEPRRRLS